MTSHKAVACLLLLIGLFSAFNLADYLLPEEANASVTYTNFTQNGAAYSLIKINGADTFLLKNNEVMSDKPQLDSALYTYYTRSYYPNETELDSLKASIKQFNDSRNNGYDYKNKEEYICRDDVLLSNGKITVSGQVVRCSDNASCTKNAMLLFSVYGQGLGLGSPTVIIGPLTDFTPSSLRMDELLANYTSRLDAMDETNVAETISYIKDTSGELQNLSLKIEKTIFRTPRLNDTADRADCNLKCWGICPSMDLDQAAAEAIKSKASALATKLAPLSTFQATSEVLYNRTMTRLEHTRVSNMATYYRDLFAPINQTGSDSISLATEALSHVQNRTLMEKLDSLRSLHSTIPEDISSHDFTNLDADIAEYSRLSAETAQGSEFLMNEYNETLEAKNLENSLLIILQSKDLDPVSSRTLELIENETMDLDAQFHDGLTLAQLNELESNYTVLKDAEQQLLQAESDTPATRVLLLFRGFARRVNTGIANMAENTEFVQRTEIPDSPTTLGLFSLLVFLSFSSIAMLVFLYIFSTNRFTVPKTGHILLASFFTLIVLLFIFSMMMFLYLGKTSTDATLPEFISDLNSRDATSIVVDLRDASFADAQAMGSCAGLLANSFEDKNKTWTMYRITPNTCTKTDSAGMNASLTSSECLEMAENASSSFVLGYSQKSEPPRFSVIYQNRAEINANLDYYESCPLVALFS